MQSPTLLEPTVQPRSHNGIDARMTRIVWGLIVMGMILRLLRYLANRSLWLDECYLANSILTYSYKDLILRPLLQWQAAPIGFLLLQKTAVRLFGTGEYALRLVPLMAGLASEPLFYLVIRRWLALPAQIIAMGMFATVEPLIYYSSEAKQYGMDVAVTLAILLLAIRVLERPQSRWRIVNLGLMGAAGIFLSHPAPFVLASAGLVLLWHSLRRGRREAGVAMLIVALLWAGLFLLNYWYFLRPLLRHEGLMDYWARDFMPYEPLGAVKWLWLALYGLFQDYRTMWLPLVDTALIAAILGVGWFWRRNRAALAMLTLPILLTLAAAMLHKYPFGSRLVLFLVPLVIALIGVGSAMIWEGFAPGRKSIGAIIVASIVLPTAGRALFFAAFPVGREEIRPVLAYIRDHHQPRDTLWVFYMSQVPFDYYESRFGLERDRYHLSGMQIIFERPSAKDPSIYRADLSALRGRGRVWVLVTHNGAIDGIDEQQLFPTILNQMGKPLNRFSARKAMALLYEMK